MLQNKCHDNLRLLIIKVIIMFSFLLYIDFGDSKGLESSKRLVLELSNVIYLIFRLTDFSYLVNVICVKFQIFRLIWNWSCSLIHPFSVLISISSDLVITGQISCWCNLFTFYYYYYYYYYYYHHYKKKNVFFEQKESLLLFITDEEDRRVKF